MAGRGPAPKDPTTRARRNKPAIPPVHIDVVAAPQPALPDRSILNSKTGDRIDIGWPQVTRDWWTAWGRAPMSAKWTETDWLTALEVARIHADFWDGKDCAPELRQRVAKLGGYPDDRKRQGFFDKPDDPKPAEGTEPAATSARSRRGGLTSLPTGEAAGQ